MAWSSGLGVVFLGTLLLAIGVAAFLTSGDGDVLPLSATSWTSVPPAISTLGYSLYVGPVALAMLDDRPGRVEVVSRATHACYASTVLIYCAMGVLGAAWLGRDTQGSKRVRTSHTLEGSPYLSRLRFPTLVSQAHMVWTEVIISPQGLVG